MSVEHIGKGYVKICVSEEELENSIAGLSQLKPILQTQVMKGNGRNTKQGLIDTAELGGQRHNRKRVKRHEKGLYMQPIQGERRRRAGQKHRLCAAADTAGIRGRLSTHYAAFIYDAVHGR